MTAPANVSFYADLAGLAALKNDAKAQSPDALKEAAKQFESLFTQMLLKSMREANRSFGEDSMFGSDQADFYQGMFDDQIAMQLSQGRGLGLAEMLVQQLKGRVMETPPAGAPPATEAPASKLDFVKAMLPHAEAAARKVGVDPHALVAQAALETGWGKSVPRTPTGEQSFNLFGIKAGAQWSGATVNVPTLEFESGVPVRKVERFRAYESAADSFLDYAKLIANNPRYVNARGTGSDVASFAAALQQGGYATDPQYAQKILGVAHEVRSLLREPGLKSEAPVSLTTSGFIHG
jgi:flagellar protein FlgJ